MVSFATFVANCFVHPFPEFKTYIYIYIYMKIKKWNVYFMTLFETHLFVFIWKTKPFQVGKPKNCRNLGKVLSMNFSGIEACCFLSPVFFFFFFFLETVNAAKQKVLQTQLQATR